MMKSETIREQEHQRIIGAIRSYLNEEISAEKLAEEIGMNFYEFYPLLYSRMPPSIIEALNSGDGAYRP